MDDFMNYLKSNLNLHRFTLVKTTANKLVIFKCCSKYTKCIYISIIDDYIEIKIDKVFDLKGMYPGIERLMISKKVFNSMSKSLNYIQKNIVI
ncbi:hypothetical protein [Romboutsia sp.]|uniref:hypothetical protein n=1 Tax=Romboutsia sp. TaxID=1965302 RepID=UPI002B5C5AE0|nr:hypothetical protein [Romboutsia sp.]HSQ90321.1 hypothetical protein [Romboutsia sp.]